jgi:hypothetical protein
MIGYHRVRKYIITCLEAEATSNAAETNRMNAAFQLAFIYKIGFGTHVNESLSSYWLQKARRPVENLDMEIQLASKTIVRNGWRNGNLGMLVAKNILRLDIPPERDAEERESELIRELEAIQGIFGKCNPIALSRKLDLAHLLETEKRFKEAELLRIELLEDIKTESQELQQTRSSSPPYSRYGQLHGHRKSGLPMPNLELPKLESEWLGLKRILACVDDRVPETSLSIRGLAVNYWWQSRWQEAEWLFVQMIHKDGAFWGRLTQRH